MSTTSKMSAWQYTSTASGLEKNLYLPATGVPKPSVTATQLLVEVYAAALNPADYKVPELLPTIPVLTSPGTPGQDFCGRVCETGAQASGYRVGELVFGVGKGSLAQYVAVEKDAVARVPEGLEGSVDEMAGVGVAGVTAFQSIVPNVQEGRGDRVFINGGSGGTGIFGLQIAKAMGCHVTTSCSGANAELCKSLGADEVLDYTAGDVVEALKEKGGTFDLVVDNVGSPRNLYKECHHFVKEEGRIVQVGAEMGVGAAVQLARNMLLPGMFGGGRRKFQFVVLKTRHEELARLAKWIEEGKVKPVVDSVWEFYDAPKAFERLKTHRAKGKVVVHVKKDLLK
ncbi:NAD(P)-binding protein [Bimuria novae-zelandiae CBS 107.79]|uniref:NAD(P)-binding protein n=1 Tax=Bimuria novae-zelandiae CBS 107.79 TaxID=1447943 RepID=A0A6A5VH93_9PLEO|nr:NAD(P)-binding protein [Bimuria novae-zelandiae CBS 107.79]